MFRHASLGSSILPGHTTTSSAQEGFRAASDVNALEMLPMEEHVDMHTVPLDDLFMHGRDQPQLMDNESPQNVPRMSAERRKRTRGIFDDRIILSRAEMFLTAEEIGQADLARIKRQKQLNEDQIMALINAPLLKCMA